MGGGDRNWEAADGIAGKGFAAKVVRQGVLERAWGRTESANAELMDLAIPWALEIDHIEALLVAAAEDIPLP